MRLVLGRAAFGRAAFGWRAGGSAVFVFGRGVSGTQGNGRSHLRWPLGSVLGPLAHMLHRVPAKKVSSCFTAEEN